MRRANQTSKCPIKYCSLPRIWKSSGAKGRDGERKKDSSGVEGSPKDSCAERDLIWAPQTRAPASRQQEPTVNRSHSATS